MSKNVLPGQGQGLTEGLRSFNEWRDDFLIELSTLLLMIGFIAGTVDVFTKGGLSTNDWFNVSWAIVQALAIDGLFFAVWGRIAKAEWSRTHALKNGMLIIVGLLLALVAALVNGILSYQELMSISSVKEAMVKLHVDQALFTYARSILVVIVAILVALFCRARKDRATDTASTISEQDVKIILSKLAELQALQAPLQGSTQVQEIAPPQASTLALSQPVQGAEQLSECKEAMKPPVQGDASEVTSEAMKGRFESKELAVRGVLGIYPQAGVEQVMELANCSKATAEKWIEKVAAEKQQEVSN